MQAPITIHDRGAAKQLIDRALSNALIGAATRRGRNTEILADEVLDALEAEQRLERYLESEKS